MNVCYTLLETLFKVNTNDASRNTHDRSSLDFIGLDGDNGNNTVARKL